MEADIYKSVMLRMKEGKTFEEAISDIEERFHTRFSEGFKSRIRMEINFTARGL